MTASFKDLEQQGWTARADSYDPFAGITAQAVPTILDRLGDIAGRDVLDICSGPGHLAGAAARRAARVTDVDFAPTMVARAAAAHPEVTFRAGDAEALAFPDGSFDAAVCSFGINHFEAPERALSEACRVLRHGGRYAASVWCGPPKGTFFALALGAVASHGTLDVDLPPTPPIFRFADEAEFARCLWRPASTTSRSRSSD